MDNNKNIKSDSIRPVLLHRKGERTSGGFKTERYSSDFIINEKSLWKMIRSSTHFEPDLMGRFVDGYPDENKKAQQVFLCNFPPDLPSKRIMIYICSECGDIGCGAITLSIRQKDSYYI